MIASIVFISTMNAHVAGGIMTENVLFRINGVNFFGDRGQVGYWTLIFCVYPIERIFFTIVGTLLAIPVLRVIPRLGMKLGPKDSN